MVAHDNAVIKRHGKLTSPNVTTNPFVTDIRDTVRADMDSADPLHSGYVGGGKSHNPFLVSMELTTNLVVSTPPSSLHFGVNNDINQTFVGRPANPFFPTDNVFHAINAPSTLVHTSVPQPAVSPFYGMYVPVCGTQLCRRGL